MVPKREKVKKRATNEWLQTNVMCLRKLLGLFRLE